MPSFYARKRIRGVLIGMSVALSACVWVGGLILSHMLILGVLGEGRVLLGVTILVLDIVLAGAVIGWIATL